MRPDLPRVLFHYQPFKPEWLEQAIVGRTLYFSTPANFNDPWDCKPEFDPDSADDPKVREKHALYYIEITCKHRPDITQEELERNAQTIRNDPRFLRSKISEFMATFSTQVAEQYRVYCLSSKPDHELMWAHYAEHHKGLCLGFTTKSPLFEETLKVDYRALYPSFDMVQADLSVLYIKSKSWRYEEEYRLVAQEESRAVGNTLLARNNLVELPDKTLTKIIAGCLAPATTVTALKEIVAKSPHPIELFRAVKAPRQYKFLFERTA